jgi:hypothetical protein
MIQRTILEKTFAMSCAVQFNLCLRNEATEREKEEEGTFFTP